MDHTDVELDAPTIVLQRDRTQTKTVSLAPVAANDPPLVLAPGGRIGRYVLGEPLGKGAFGLVFEAHDPDLDRAVALKILNPVHAQNRDVVHRFLQEARATARIAHPGVVTLLDSGRVPTAGGETAYITMELLQGESLTSRLNRCDTVMPDVAVEIGRQVASALEAAHRAGVLHRDLKPDNIFLVRDPAVPWGERTKVLDFGLAKLRTYRHTLANSVFGTPWYMSPEQCRSATKIDPRSDIYALGCILFELIVGHPPFSGDLRQLIELHQRAIPPRACELEPHTPPALDDLIARMLEKDPAARPQTMDLVQRELELVTATSVGDPATPLPTPPLTPMPMPMRHPTPHPIPRPTPTPARHPTPHPTPPPPLAATPAVPVLPELSPAPATNPPPFDPAESIGELLVPPSAAGGAAPSSTPKPRETRSPRLKITVALVLALVLALVAILVIVR